LSPAGRCLLTDRNLAARLRDLFAHREQVVMHDIHLLKVGRHFRFGGRKFVAGRDAGEQLGKLTTSDSTAAFPA